MVIFSYQNMSRCHSCFQFAFDKNVGPVRIISLNDQHTDVGDKTAVKLPSRKLI
jgi:hypothetical protein